jgi:FKBP-type peptidyl-prolyl cis-trans isomerase FkpA/FKBP-type peptidyl-prolyl cis-trans isomerase FklB
MKNLFTLALVAVLGLTIGCDESGILPTAEMETPQDSLSYAYGVQLAEMLKQQNKNLDPDVVAAAVKEALEENSQLTLEQCQEIVVESREKASIQAQSAGITFLQENASKSGVKTTASGLQYKHISEGTGESPNASSTVTIHYTGRLVDGTVFDSSVDSGEPIVYPVNGFIAGWVEGLQLMKAGGKMELYVPSNLGYGAQGVGGAVPPNAVLIFVMELISFE